MNSSRGINALLLLVVSIAVAGVAWLYLGEWDDSRAATSTIEPVAVIAQRTRTQPLADRIQALGNARASQAVEITPEVSGVIATLSFEPGATVEAGEVLATLGAADMQANLEAAQASAAQSLSAYERQRELFRSNLVSESQLQLSETLLRTDRANVAVAEAALAEHVIRAPFDGRLGLREVSVGSLVQPGTLITTLDDLTPVELEFTVPALYVGTLEPGQAITARSAAYPDIEFSGTVQTVATRVDPVTRSVRVRAVLPNPARLIKPGMLLTVRLTRGTTTALLIPEHAVVPENDRQFVFVIENGVAQSREVKTGARRLGLVEITGGLRPGESIIVEGTLKVRDGTPVTRIETPQGGAFESQGNDS
ncbi:membrane fusion protein, multidrug efflux system [Modicisalibacter muralis]|uniref:Membrane fusion protein, multidrug efflux system n=1 Tax=Modicisalibacter muralis TaxID=119000 RepID=A0A1G9K1K3_9GAMM|nr:efflux RND transporter periplasmic adaptor subunit [Halomonas muralis]SDL43336.1 membrane fusion protein, multidrug efflux system [Halomonas muralis]